MTNRLRIGVVGCGALGSFYGARLARTGADVHFLLRSDYEVVRRDGVLIEDAAGGFRVHPACARLPEEIGICDWVVIGLKTTANGEFRRLLTPLVGPATAVLTLQNGLGNEEALAELLGEGRVLGGLCFVCLNRIAPGVVRHLAHGRVVAGEFRRPVSDRLRQFAALMVQSGVRCETTDHLERAHWEKLVWNIPFNGLGVASAAGWDSVVAGRWMNPGHRGECLSTDRLLADGRWFGLVEELMRETVSAALAQGLELPADVVDQQIARTREMGPYLASTLVDYDRGQPLEVESLFGEPLRRARAARVATPRLEALYSLLKDMEVRR